MFDDIFGENVQEVAEPAIDNAVEGAAEVAADADDGVNDQEVAEPKQNETQTDAGGGEVSKPSLSADERRANAAIRRQQEEASRQAAMETERRANQARIDAAYAQAYQGQTNPYTGRPIMSEQDFKAYQTQYQQAQQQEALAKMGIDPQALQAVVEQSPTVQGLRSELGQMKQSADAARFEQGRQLMEREVAVIAAMEPSVKTVEDVLNSEKGPEIVAMVTNKGLTLAEAYKLAYFDTLSQKRAQAAKAGAVAQGLSKGHLRASSGSGGTPGLTLADIPSDTLELYRQMNPEASDAEIVKHYASSRA